jgi:hypothetical protein
VSLTYTQQSVREQSPMAVPPFHDLTFPDGTVWSHFYRCDAGYLLRFPGLADFEVSCDGSQVQAWPVPGVTNGTVEHLYLNQVVPLALSRQGKLMLHGSSVDVDGQGVAFLGVSGRGKSTLATSFATRGRRFLSDDGLHLEWAGTRFQVIPSHPSVRLWQDSQDALDMGSTPMAPAIDFTTKARLLAGGDLAYSGEPLPLRRIYFLGPGDAPSVTIQALKPAAALIALTRQCFILDVDQQDALARHFDDLCRLSNLPVHFDLDYPRRYEDLSRVREAILRHANEDLRT